METAMRNLVSGFTALNNEVHLFGLGESTLDATWHRDLPWTQVGEARGHPIRQLLSLSFHLGKALKGYRPDVVITPTASSILIARLAFIWSGGRFPLASWLHFSLKAVGWKKCLRLADCQVAISRGVADELRVYLGSSQEIFTVHNGTNLNVEPIDRPDDSSPVKFVYVGRMFIDGQKRVNDILAAAARLKGNFQITMVGAGEDLARLQEMARDLEIDSKFTWAGWQSDPWMALGSAHALLLTSSYEGFPMVLIEAMSRGLPCISSNCEVGPADVIRPNQNGWLFPVGDVEALAALMQRIIDNRSVLPSPRDVIESVRPFSIETVTDKFLAALRSIIPSKSFTRELDECSRLNQKVGSCE